MKRFWPIVKLLLIAWGILCLIGAITLGGFIAYKMGPGNTDSSEIASKQDVRYVLNWCGLGDDRIEKVVHSYISSRSFTGDHLDAHAILITHVAESELKKDEFGSGWTRCDQVAGVLKDAMEFAEGWLHSDDIAWFPRSEELRSADMYIYPWSIYCHGTRPSAVELIFVRPKDRMVFFISSKT